MNTRIFLIRHGATEFSAEERFAGSVDVNLSEEGKRQAQRLGQRLAKERIDAAYCSDMKRTIMTATLVAQPHGIVPIPTPGLREIDHGHWEGKVHKDVEKEFADEYKLWASDPITHAPPGGETGLSVLARALPAIRKIVDAHVGQNVLVASHKATNRLLLCSLLGIDLRSYRTAIAQDLACLNVIDFPQIGQAQVSLLNDTGHYATWQSALG